MLYWLLPGARACVLQNFFSSVKLSRIFFLLQISSIYRTTIEAEARRAADEGKKILRCAAENAIFLGTAN